MDEQLDTNFRLALAEVDTHGTDIMKEASTTEQLVLYGLYKQALEGPPKGPAPSLFQARSYKKFQSWKSYGDLSSNEAKKRYMQALGAILDRMPADLSNPNVREALSTY